MYSHSHTHTHVLSLFLTHTNCLSLSHTHTHTYCTYTQHTQACTLTHSPPQVEPRGEQWMVMSEAVYIIPPSCSSSGLTAGHLLLLCALQRKCVHVFSQTGTARHGTARRGAAQTLPFPACTTTQPTTHPPKDRYAHTHTHTQTHTHTHTHPHQH